MIPLELIKAHLNIESRFHEDDTLLQTYAKAAEEVVQQHIDEELSSLRDGDGNLPSPLQQAVLLLVGDFYQSRESVAFNSAPVELPLSFNYLLSLYKNYYGGRI